MIFDVETEKREDFDATTDRETISIQNNDFRDVAIDVTDEIIENELWKIDFAMLIDDVRINVDSLDVNVTRKIDNAIDAIEIRFAIVVILTNFAFDVSIDATNDCFNVEKNVNIAIVANIAFDANWTISRRNEIEDANTFDVDFSDFFDAKYFSIARIQWHVEKCSQCFR